MSKLTFFNKFFFTNLFYILILLSLFIFVIPHYNKEGKYCLFGSYYTRNNYEKNNELLKRNNQKLLNNNNKLLNSQKKLKNTNQKIKNNFSKIQQNNQKILNYKKDLQKNNSELENKFYNINQQNVNFSKQLNNLQQNNNLLKSKLSQQESFIQTSKQEEKYDNNMKQELKKRQFSNVSLNTVSNERPDFGNMFSKSIKKTTTTKT